MTIDELVDTLSQINYDHARKLLLRPCSQCHGNPVDITNARRGFSYVCIHCRGSGTQLSPFAEVVQAVLAEAASLRS